MDDTKEAVARKVNRTLHDTLHRRESAESKYTIPNGFVFGRNPQILALRIMHADSISEMPRPEVVREEIAAFTLPDPKDFLQTSSLRKENAENLLDDRVVNALFLKSRLDNDPSATLDRFNLTLAFSVVCRGNARNGQPCCTQVPRFYNQPDNLQAFRADRNQALKEVGSILHEKFWT